MEKTKATKSEVDHFFRWAKKSQMLATRKATHGMIVTILKYNDFQTLDSYKSDTKSDTEATQKRHRSDNIQKKGSKGSKGSNNNYSENFETFWKSYPGTIKGSKKDAHKVWRANSIPDLGILLERMQGQKSARDRLQSKGEFTPEWPHAVRYLRGERWEDEFKEKEDQNGGKGNCDRDVENFLRDLGPEE